MRLSPRIDYNPPLAGRNGTLARTMPRRKQRNGHEANGHNGHKLNGHKLNGHKPDGLELNGLELNGRLRP